MLDTRPPRSRITHPRPVLFPQGQAPDADDREHCTRLVLAAGGDVARFLDSPAESLDRYIHLLSRIHDISSGAVAPIVVLTRTNPLPLAVLHTRRRLERAVPHLRAAHWMIYLRPDHDPFFDSSASLGWLVGELNAAPVWVGPNMEKFVVISRRVDDVERLRSRLASLGRDEDRRKRGSDPPRSGPVARLAERETVPVRSSGSVLTSWMLDA